MRKIERVYPWKGRLNKYPCVKCNQPTNGIVTTPAATWNLPCGCRRGPSEGQSLTEAEIAPALLMGPTS